MKRTLFSLTLLLAAALLTGCSVVGSRISHALGGEVDMVINEKTTSAKKENLTINWKSGDVDISTWDGDELIVREKSVTSLTSRTRMRISEGEGYLSVDFSAKGVWMLPMLFKKDLEVLVPSSWDLKSIEVATASAPVHLEGISTLSLDVHSASGDITLSDMGVLGETKLRSASGTIRSTVKAGVMFMAESASGSVETEIGGKTTAVETKSSSGKVETRVNEAGRVTASSASGKVDVTVSSRADYIDAKSVSGSVVLKLGKETTGFLMDATSTSGTVRCDFPSSVIGDQYTWGDGSTKIRLRSTSGKVHTTQS
ncbi:MAG: DUF4097 family beta strand repeat-containing protein [Candidatus Ornithospirochaeta sp.]